MNRLTDKEINRLVELVSLLPKGNNRKNALHYLKRKVRKNEQINR